MLRLEKATTYGHTTAAYVVGLILTCSVLSTDVHKNKGMELLKEVKEKKLELRLFIVC